VVWRIFTVKEEGFSFEESTSAGVALAKVAKPVLAPKAPSCEMNFLLDDFM
jgi:hypothetical protein